jgi:hypothetical protein
MNTHVNGSPKGHLVTQCAVAVNDSCHGGYGSVEIAVSLSFIEVAHDLAEITRPVTELSELPVDDEQLVSPVCQWRLSPPSTRKENAGVENVRQEKIQLATTG